MTMSLFLGDEGLDAGSELRNCGRGEYGALGRINLVSGT